MGTELESLTQRLEKLENNVNQEVLTLVEILSNATFFGKMKMALCKHAHNGQCGLFFVDNTGNGKFPFATPCRIKDCVERSPHLHIDLTNITCSLCHES